MPTRLSHLEKDKPFPSATTQQQPSIDESYSAPLQMRYWGNELSAAPMSIQEQYWNGEDSPNRTGISDAVKANFEQNSGFSFDDVRVHRNSEKPDELGALAYTQGNQVYLGPGQEEHLEHELGHVVQQKQGRVRPTMQMKGVAINDDVGLEQEASLTPLQMQYGGSDSSTSRMSIQEQYRDRVNYPNENILQFQFDELDLNSIQKGIMDEDIRDEIMEIYQQNQDTMTYGNVSKGAGAQIRDGKLTAVIPNRAGWLHRWRGTNDTDDIIRQSMIMHELTHLAVAKHNREGDSRMSQIDNPDLKELTAMVTPKIDDKVIQTNLDKLHQKLDGARIVLGEFQYQFSRNPSITNLYKYIGFRLEYAGFQTFEYPAVLNELHYLLNNIDNKRFDGLELSQEITKYAIESRQTRM